MRDNTTPRTELRDALLADLSANVTDPDVLDAVEYELLDSIQRATITGPGRMVDFETFNEVAL